MGQPLVLDIETLALASSLALPYVPADNPPPANYKSEEAIAGHHAKKEREWGAKIAKQASINPRLGRVLCLGTSNRIGYALNESDEAALLNDFWAQAKAADGYIVSWNGTFDLRFLLIRSLFHGITPSVAPATIREWFRKYSFSVHFDTKAALSNWDLMSSEGLDEWSKFFGLAGKPDDTDGSAVAYMYAEGMHDEIKQYCASDVAHTGELYRRLVPYFGGAL